MSTSNSSSTKPSGLKQPAKITRPNNIYLEKNVDVSDGVNSSVRSLTKDEQNKKFLNDESRIDWDGTYNSNSMYRRRESDASSITVLTEDTENFIVGDRVWVGGTKPGVIAYVGETQFGPGDWAGVVLDEPIGKNDGSVAGFRYFQCATNKGIFSRLSRLSRYPLSDPSATTCPISVKTPSTPDRNHSVTSSCNVSRVKALQNCSKVTSGSSIGDTKDLKDIKDVKVGDRVIIQSSHGSKAGVLRYYGTADFGVGLWCGVELDDPLGKNDGSIAGTRYFECAPKFGLFVPIEKVSRSPISKKNSPCVVHPNGLTRQGTLDSLRSSTSVNTNASSLRSNSRVRLGVNSLVKQKPVSRTSVTSSRLSVASATPAPKSPLQEQIKESETYIKQLLKDRELERAQITRAATQAEEAEKKLAFLKHEYNQNCAQNEITKTNLLQTIGKLEKEKIELNQRLDDKKKTIEDLQFNYEEESITKSEVQALNVEYVAKLKNLEKIVTSQHTSLEYDGTSSGIFEAANDVSTSTSVTETDAQLESIPSLNLVEELNVAKKTIRVFTEKVNELQQECAGLRESIEKQKLLDKSKDEMIKTLESKITTYQQSEIDSRIDEAPEDFEILKFKLAELEDENKSAKHKQVALNEKISYLERELTRKNGQLVEKNQEIRNATENLKNNLEFELDEYKVKADEMRKQLNQLTEELSSKENAIENNVNVLAYCLNTLSSDLNDKNEVIGRIMMSNERTSQALDVLRRKDSAVYDALDKCPEEVKEKLVELEERIEQLANKNVMLLEKLETLNEVITKKDVLLDEATKEKEALRKDFRESVDIKVDEIKRLENKYIELDKVKTNIERHLKLGEENVKKLEFTFSEKRNEAKSETETIKKDLCAKSLEVDQLHREISTLKAVLESLTEKNKTYENDGEKSKTKMEELRAELRTAIHEKIAAQKDYEEFRKYNELKTEVKLFENDCAALSDQIKDLECSMTDDDKTKKSNECDELRTRVDGLIIENKTKDEMVDELQRKCKQYEDKERDLEEETTQLKKELKSTVANLEAKQSDITKYENEIKTMREKMEINGDLCSRLKDLQDKHESLINLNKTLESSKSELETRLKRFEEESTQTTDFLNAVAKEKEELSKKIEQYYVGNLTLDEQIQKRDQEVAEIQKELHDMKIVSDRKLTELKDIRENNKMLETTNQSLLQELEAMKLVVDTLKTSVESKDVEMNNEKLKFQERLQVVTRANDELKEKRRKYSETSKEMSDLRENLNILQNETQNKEKTYQNNIAELKKSIEHLQHEKEKVFEECKNVLNEFESTKNELDKLKARGDILFENQIPKLEQFNNVAPASDSLNNNIIAEGNDSNKRNDKLLVQTDLQSAASQIDFLNSVIVDMQLKNKDLLKKMQYLENHDSSAETKPKKTTPRLFCDICDMFDLHETEDCSKQSTVSPVPERRTPKTKPLPRPYCDNCEVFGHDTNKCNNDETF